MLQIMILTRFLEKEDFGIIAIALLVIQFTHIFLDMGFSSAILHCQNATKKQYSSIYWLNIVISILLFLVVYVCTPFVVKFYQVDELRFVVPLLGFNLLLNALGRQHRTIMQKEFKFSVIAKIELLSFFFGLLLAVSLAYKEYGVYSLVYSTLTVSLISNILFLFSNIKKNPILFRFRIIETKPFFKIGIYSMGSRLIDFFSRETDILIIGKTLDPASLGVYSLCKQVSMKLFTVLNPVVLNVLAPYLSSIQKHKKLLRANYLNVVKFLSLLCFPVFLLIMVSAKEILYVLYGYEYIKYSLILILMAFSFSLISISAPVGCLQIATGRTDIGFKWTIVRLVVSTVLIAVGSVYGLEGVTIAFASTSFLLVMPLWYMQLKPMLNIGFYEYLYQFIYPLAVFVVFFAVSLFISVYVDDTNLLFGILKAVLSFIAFIVFMIIFQKQDLLELQGLLIKKK